MGFSETVWQRAVAQASVAVGGAPVARRGGGPAGGADPAAVAPRADAEQPEADSSGSAARAAETSEQHRDVARVLFRQARRLLGEQRFEAACSKFRESLALHRSPGTLLNVANCLSREGDLLAAIHVFEEAEVAAAQVQESQLREVWVRAAREHAQELESRLATVRFAFDESIDVARSQVELDGVALEPRAAVEPLRRNPGPLRVRISSPGRVPLALALKLAEGERRTVAIPWLPAEQSGLVAPPRQPSGARATAAAPSLAASESRELGVPITLSGLGGALVATGLVFGALAVSDASALDGERCPDKICPEGYEPLQSARSRAVWANVLVGTGALLGAVGVTWWVIEGTRERPRVGFQAGCGAGRGCGFALDGRF